MRALRIALGLLTVLIVAAWIETAAAAQEQTWIVVASGGKDRVGAVPLSKPYTLPRDAAEGGPWIAVPVDRFDVRAGDGQVLTAFEFASWTEGDAIRVMVSALIPKEGAANTYMGIDRTQLQRRDFASYRLSAGESHPVAEMKALDVEPMVIRAELRK